MAVGAAGVGGSALLPPAVLSVDVAGTVGVADGLSVRMAWGYGAAVGEDSSTHLARGRLELSYALDVLQWVPFVGLGGGMWGADLGRGFRLSPEGHALLGLDYLASRSWTYGLDLRGGGVLLSGDHAWYVEAQLRISRVFELF